MQRVIREQEPAKPSTKLSTLGETLTDIARQRNCSSDLLRRTLRGDLDWIVMKSLEKDRTRRYDSTSALLDDIKRHLDHEPVSAGPPSAWYRTKKFLQRHRILVLAATVIVVTIVTGLGTSTAMYLRAERARAETQTVTDFLTKDLLASVYPERAKTQEVTVRYILETAAKNLEGKFQNSPLAEAAIRETLGVTYQKMGDYSAAEPHLQRALEIRTGQLGQDDPSTLASLSQIGRIYVLQGEYENARTALEAALARRIRVLGEEHPDTLESMGLLAELNIYRANFDGAYPLVSKVQQVGERVLGEEHPVVLRAMLGDTYLHTYSFHKDRAYSVATKGLQISRRALGEEHEITLSFMTMLANIHRERERFDEAENLLVTAFETGERVLGQGHPVTINAMSHLGKLYRTEGRYEEAGPLLTKAMELARRQLGWGHIWTLLSAMRLANFYEAEGQYETLETTLIEALENGCPMQGNRQLTGWFRWKFQKHTIDLSAVARGYYDVGDYENAASTLRRQEQLRRSPVSEDAESPPSDVALLAMSLYQAGRRQEADTELLHLRQMFEGNEYTHEERFLFEAERLFASNDSVVCKAWNLIEGGELETASHFIGGLPRHPGDNDPDGRIQSLTNALARAYCIRGSRARGRGEYTQAISDYESSLQTNPGCARAHKRLARLLSTCQVDEVRDGLRAVEHGIRACELTEWANASHLATLAAAHAEAGDFPSAVKCQRQAIGLLSESGHEEFQEHYETRLRLYESAKPYHRSMVAWWTFDQVHENTVFDASGNELNGRLIGDAHVIEDLDRPGQVIYLDGAGDWVDCGNDVRLHIISEITIACWTKVRKFDKPRQTIISKSAAWKLVCLTHADRMEFGCVGLVVPNNMYGAVQGRTNVNDGQWHHLAGVWDGTSIHLYVDGELDVSSEASGNIKHSPFKVWIGENDKLRMSEGQNRSFNGLIDDVRIYDYALSAPEIKALHNNAEPETVRRK